MSFLGRVEGRCPQGCEPAEFEVWTFVRGDRDEDLRLALLAGELNLVICQGCGRPFFPDATLVYVDPPAGVVAFVFPEGYRADEERWRGKMHEDFASMREALGPELPLVDEPAVYFGYDEARGALQADDDREDEARVAEFLLPGLGLKAYAVDAAFARRRGLPRFVPLKGAR
ncbi:MAG: hypothetical protein KGL53_05145, partial [Elusimicrobia bacterium]|nr:hypothetical protein [Elusimicrobiota bacterium]